MNSMITQGNESVSFYDYASVLECIEQRLDLPVGFLGLLDCVLVLGGKQHVSSGLLQIVEEPRGIDACV